MPFPVDISLVRRTEAKLGRKLPLGYVAKICTNNGGAIKAGIDCWSLSPVFDDSDRARLMRTCNDIVRESTSARGWAGFPADAVAIGSNGTGGKLAFVAEPETDRCGDAVDWWDRETGELNEVADAFDELNVQ